MKWITEGQDGLCLFLTITDQQLDFIKRNPEYYLDKDFVKEINSFVLNLNNSSMNINRNTNIILRFISKSYDLFVVNKGSANLLFT
jgi:hypothetical protein